MCRARQPSVKALALLARFQGQERYFYSYLHKQRVLAVNNTGNLKRRVNPKSSLPTIPDGFLLQILMRSRNACCTDARYLHSVVGQ